MPQDGVLTCMFPRHPIRRSVYDEEYERTNQVLDRVSKRQAVNRFSNEMTTPALSSNGRENGRGRGCTEPRAALTQIAILIYRQWASRANSRAFTVWYHCVVQGDLGLELDLDL